MSGPPVTGAELAAIPLFEGADDSALASLAAASERLMLPEGAVLFRERDPASTVYWLESGRIGLRVDHEGRSILVMTLGPADLLGWAALESRATALTTARAISDVRLVAMPAEALLDLLASGSPASRQVIRRIFGLAAAHLEGTRRQLLQLGREGVISAG